MKELLPYFLTFLAGSVLFFIAFSAAFNGSNVVAVGAILAYSLAGFLLGTIDSRSHRVLLLCLMTPAVPLVTLFSIALIRESRPVAALWWPGGLLVATVLAIVGCCVGRWVVRSRCALSRRL